MSVFSDLLPNLRIADLLDIGLVAMLLYVLFLALKQTRTTFLVVGIGILAVVYVLALTLDLRLTRHVLQLMFAVALVGLIVLFHEEIRGSVERFLSWHLRRRRGAPENSVATGVIAALIDTVTDLARDRIGALIVIPGMDDPSRFIRGGSHLNGVVSEALLKSIFDPHSAGHDGAVVLSNDRVERFACHLPLSTNAEQIGERGTRHAAALGLSEKADSLCLVVSEERGVIAVAHEGELNELHDLVALNQVLGDFYRAISPAEQQRRPVWRDALRKHLPLKAAALVSAMILWFLIVHESSTEYRNFTVVPSVVGLRPGQVVGSIKPDRIGLIVSGPRRSFYLIGNEDFQVDVKLFDREPGTHDVFLAATDVALPEGVTFVNIVPTRLIQVTINP